MLPGAPAYSADLRLKMLSAVDRGVPRRQAAKVFGVSVPTIERYRRRQTGRVDPSPRPGRPAAKAERLRAWLPGRLRERNDATLAERCARFAEETGVGVSTATMSRAIASLPAADAEEEGGPPGDGRGRRPGWTLKQRRS